MYECNLHILTDLEQRYGDSFAVDILQKLLEGKMLAVNSLQSSQLILCKFIAEFINSLTSRTLQAFL
jgi:hypothetical protein